MLDSCCEVIKTTWSEKSVETNTGVNPDLKLAVILKTAIMTMPQVPTTKYTQN